MSERRGRLPALGAVEIVALVVPLLTIAALALVRPADDPSRSSTPTRSALTRSTIVCPPAGPIGSDTVSWGSAEDVTGDVAVTGERTIAIDGTRRSKFAKAVWATGEGDLAPGLLGTRSGDDVAATCDVPRPEQWFAGVGASPEHSSTLILTNPDVGPAVADVTVLGAEGPRDVPQLRGVTVPGGETTEFDLAEIVPSSQELAVHVEVPRGRLGVHVLDTIDDLGRTPVASDWLPAQADAAGSIHLVGLGDSPGDRTLVVANTGETEARVEMRMVTEQSEFSPDGVEELRIAPGATASVDLTPVLRGRAGRGAIGLRLDATQPIAATLRTRSDGDLSHAVGGTAIHDRAAMLVPSGPARLAIAGADAVGDLGWTALDARGRELDSGAVRLSEARGWQVELPARTSLVEVTVKGASVVAAVESGSSATVLPLRPLETTRLVPHVEPALR